MYICIHIQIYIHFFIYTFHTLYLCTLSTFSLRMCVCVYVCVCVCVEWQVSITHIKEPEQWFKSHFALKQQHVVQVWKPSCWCEGCHLLQLQGFPALFFFFREPQNIVIYRWWINFHSGCQVDLYPSCRCVVYYWTALRYKRKIIWKIKSRQLGDPMPRRSSLPFCHSAFLSYVL